MISRRQLLQLAAPVALAAARPRRYWRPHRPTIQAVRSDMTNRVTWNAPASGGSPITSYTVQRRPTGGTFALLTTVAASALTYDDTTAVVGTTYGYRVAAVNAVGTGPFSLEATVPTGTPTAPTGASIMGYGAVGDGVADDAPALRAALAANQSVYIPAGTYKLGSFESPRQTRLVADFICSLKSGQTLTADPNATMKFANGIISASATAYGGNLFMIDTQNDVTITGGVWDFNGANNLDTTALNLTGYGVYTYGANRVTVQNLTMKNTPGQNFIVQQGNGDTLKLLNCTFQNGGTSLAGSQQVDYSAGYFTGTNVTIDGCHVTNDVQPYTYSGGFELHGPNQSVTNCVIEKSWPAVYIGPDASLPATGMTGITITGNQMLQCGRGLIFNAGGTLPIDTVNFSNNTIHLKSFPPLGSSRGVDQDAPGGAVWDYHHTITNLTMNNNFFYDDDNSADFGIRLSQIQSGVIQSNRFDSITGQIFQLAGNPFGGTKNVTFSNNTATWLDTSGPPAIVLSFGSYLADNIRIVGNSITRTVASSSASGVYLEGTGSLTNIFVTSNTFTGIGIPVAGPQASKITYTP